MWNVWVRCQLKFSASHTTRLAVLACPRERPSQQADKIYEWILDESNLPRQII